MPNKSIESLQTSTRSKHKALVKNGAKSRRPKATPAAKFTKVPDPPGPEPRVTKQEMVLTMLSGANGASIDEIIQATDWQQHSIRGFFAGPVKKKLGFNLTSSKADGSARRYRIKTRWEV